MDPSGARLQTCFKRVFPNLPDQEILRARIGETPEWDSLATVTLFSLIDEEFGLSLDIDDFEETMSFQGLLTRIQDSTVGA